MKKPKIRVNGRSLPLPKLEGDGDMAKFERILIKWITNDILYSESIDNMTQKIRFGIRISAFKQVLARFQQVCSK